MPDPDKLLATIHKAAEYSRNTPGRRGRIVHLCDAIDVFVTGDLHGNLGNFQQFLQLADLARHPRRHFVMQELIHGPFRYPDGSDKSHQAVDLWCALKCQFPTRVHFLPGNHEVSQWTNRAIAKGQFDLNANFLDGVRHAYGRHADLIYAAYLELFQALPVAVRTPNRVLISHSLPTANAMHAFAPDAFDASEHNHNDLAPGGFVYSLVWGRDCSTANVAEYLRRADSDWLISGHIPCDAGFAVPNDRQIILDSLGSPASYCLFPATTQLTSAELLNCVKTI